MPFCTRCGRENAGDARFCAGCGTPLAPVARREERKVVTVLFADIVGSTARAEGLDPEDVRAFLARYHERTRHELERYGGTVEKFIGDAVVAVFGAPVAHDDDPERAVRAAFAVVDAVAELNEEDPELGLEVRVGVNTGETLVSLGARPEAGEVMVAGDVTNTCARLQAAAPPGGVLVGEQTFHATERVIDYRAVGPVDAKGRKAPVAAWLAVGPRARLGVDLAGGGRASLVGRTDELDALRGALQRVRTAHAPHLVTLTGVAGIGKSRLVHELLRIVDDDEELIVWRQGRSLPYGEGVAYWALGEMVKAQAGILESDTAEAAEEKLVRETTALLEDAAERAWVERHLRPLVGLSAGDGDELAGESMAAWRRFFEALAERNVTVLVFEDLHLADDGLLDFVDELVDNVGSVTLLVVCTARAELLERRPGWGGGKRNAQTVSLTPLSDDETAVLLESLLDRGSLTAARLAALVESAGGVPLFAEEYARMVEGDRARSGIPASLQGILGARLDGLDLDEKRLVHAASVLGKVFWTDALSALTGASNPDSLLRSLERKEFFRRERRSAVAGASQYTFLHSLLRDAAYAQIPRGERARLHRLAADWIDSLESGRANDRAEMLAHHLLSAIELGRAAGVGVDDLRSRAVDALRRAGDRTWWLAAPQAAARLYRRALEVMGGDEPDPMVRFNLGRALVLSGSERARGLEELERARSAFMERGDREHAAAALVFQHEAGWVTGEDVGTRLLEEARALVDDLPDSIPRVRVVGTVARFFALSGRAAESLSLAESGLDTVRRLGDRELEGWLLNTRGLSRLNLGDVDGIDDLERARAIAEEIGSTDLVRSHVNLGGINFQLGNLDVAHHHHRVALDLCERRGFRPYARWVVIELAQDAFVAGDWAEAQRLVASRLEATDGGASYMDVQARFLALELAASTTGAVDEDALESLVADAYRVADPQVVLPVLGGAARLMSRFGASERVGPLLDAFLEHAADGNLCAWELYVAIAAGDRDRSAGLLALAERGARSRWSEASRLAAAGDHVGAADVLAAIGALTDEAGARLHAATLLAESGERGAAAEQALRAAAFYDEVGATWLAERARALEAATVA